MKGSRLPVRVLIVDDEPAARELLQELLSRFCTDAQVVGVARDAEEAVQLIRTQAPDLLLLDLQMPAYNGFELLEMLPDAGAYFKVFVTAYDTHALQAFKHEALDYLVKPVGPAELIRVIDRVHEALAAKHAKETAPADGTTRFRLPTATGFRLLHPQEIEAVLADRAYAEIVLSSGEKHLVSQSLQAVLRQLPQPPFLQVHRSHAVNMELVRAYDRTNGNDLFMASGKSYPVARARLEAVLAALEG